MSGSRNHTLDAIFEGPTQTNDGTNTIMVASGCSMPFRLTLRNPTRFLGFLSATDIVLKQTKITTREWAGEKFTSASTRCYGPMKVMKKGLMKVCPARTRTGCACVCLPREWRLRPV